MALSILTLLLGWGKDLLEVTMGDCCDTENAELQQTLINSLHSQAINSCLCNIT